jgi:hypothetical protein
VLWGLVEETRRAGEALAHLHLGAGTTEGEVGGGEQGTEGPENVGLRMQPSAGDD